MPNYCTNHLTVTGPETSLTDFLTATADRDGHLRFHHLAPVTQPHGDDPTNQRIISAQVNTWGTKWDLAHDETFQRTDTGDAVILFDTAWSPPTEWVLTASQLYPALTFTLAYDEPGVSFAGVSIIQDGEMLDGSWQGESQSWTACPYPDCDESVEGLYPWDTEFSKSTANHPRYCDDHQLVEAVVRANLTP